VLVQVYEQGHAAAVELEGSWLDYRKMCAVFVCLSLANVEFIVQTGGWRYREDTRSNRAGRSTEEALREVLHSDYGDLMQGTAEYLKKSYGSKSPLRA